MPVEAPTPISERSPESLQTMPTAELVREVIDETRQLVRLEVELAKEDMKIELRKAERAGIAAGVVFVSTILLLCMLAVAVVLAFGKSWLAALIVAACFLVVGGGAGLYGYTALPKKPLERTRGRLQTDVNQLKEHIA